MGGVPSKPTDMTVEPKVIAAGYSRTGTSSMAKSLEILLDGPVLHGGSAMYGREDGTSLHLTRAYRIAGLSPKVSITNTYITLLT
jgi:hypothetical protein